MPPMFLYLHDFVWKCIVLLYFMCLCSYPPVFNEPFGEEGLFEGRHISDLVATTQSTVQRAALGTWCESPVPLCVCHWVLVIAHQRHEKHWGHEATIVYGNSLLLCPSFVFLPGLFRSFHGWVHLFKSAWWDSGESSQIVNLISAPCEAPLKF